jgi:hypothetical protein
MLEQLERVVIAFAIIALTAGIVIGGAVGGIIGWLMSIPLIVIIPVGMATGAMVIIAMIAIWYRGGDNLMVGTILNAVLLIGIIAAIIVAATDPSMSTAAAIVAAIFGLISLLAHFFYFRA